MPVNGVTQINVANEAQQWLNSLLTSGAVYWDANDHFQIPDAVLNLVYALHTTLAGGEVKVTVTVQGDPGRKDALDASFRKAVDATNALIKQYGRDVAMP